MTVDDHEGHEPLVYLGFSETMPNMHLWQCPDCPVTMLLPCNTKNHERCLHTHNCVYCDLLNDSREGEASETNTAS